MNADGRRCDGVTRREILRVGAVSALGLTLTDFMRLRSAAAAPQRDVSCILIWLDGGPSHLDTFDLKPDAPIEVRGEFRPIATNVPGIQICEHLPLTAQQMDRVAVLRSLTSSLGDHDTASQFMLTGTPPSPSVEHPSYGAVVAYETLSAPRSGPGARSQEPGAALPPYVIVPALRASAGSGAGFLPARCRPFAIGGDPSRAEFRVQDLFLPEEVTSGRLDRRRAFLKAMDAFSRAVESGPATQGRDAAFEQAYRLITSQEAKQAFDLTREPQAMRDRYGRHRLGQSCLLARRLIEAGSRFVTVTDTGWDHHQNVFRAMREGFPGKLPGLDKAYSALLEDLRQRGLLASTLVLLMGEFGRTPKVNSAGGRDHWPRASFVCLAGGGVRGGQVIGATDARGEAPDERPLTPQDLACTIYALLGIDAGKEYLTPDGRPIRLVTGGAPIRELVA
jgi:hypothetical protein